MLVIKVAGLFEVEVAVMNIGYGSVYEDSYRVCMIFFGILNRMDSNCLANIKACVSVFG